MDLRSMLNEGAAPAGAPASSARPPPPPPHPRPGSQQQRRQHPPPQHALPSTPVQTAPPHPFHDHPPSTQPSPARTMSREYHPAHQTPFASPPPPSYGAPTPYAAPGRPQPPPLQHLSGSVDMRSPGAGPAPMQSPYTRNTPNSSARAESAAYPFPSPGRPHPDSASPLQQHRYPPSGPYPPRDGFPQQSGPMASPGPVGHPPLGYFPSQQPPVPQTPPVGTPGGAHPYLTQGHQRSASAQSHNSYPSQPFVSPVNTNHHPPPSDQIVRQPSQPPTPHGPPLSAGPRHQSAGPGTFAQPPSPYQPRISTAGGPYPPYPPSQHPQQPPQQQQPSPHVHSRPQPSPHPLLQRAPSVYDQPPAHPHAVDPQRSSLSQSERDRSVSVSPKTRVPSLPSSAGHHSQASLSGPSGHPADFDPRDPRQVPSNPAPMRDAPLKLEREAPPLSSAARPDRATTPAKRKLDDRDIKPEDLDRQEPRPAPFQANGIHRPGISSRPSAAHRSSSPVLARRRRRHADPPVWAQSCDRQQLKNPNFLLRKPHVNHAHVNGSAEPPSATAHPERASSRHVSPEASRSSNVPAPPVNAEPPVATPIISKPKYLGPWEVTMANQEPFDELCRVVADFLFLHVVNPAELRDLHVDPHCHFEIEAKLGCLVERDRGGARIQLPVQSEVALAVVPNPHYNFSSSMTELQHKNFNDYLNFLVAETSPQNPKYNKNSANPRVPVNYVHTREVDSFYNPKDMRQILHQYPVLQNLVEARGGRVPSVRVTKDMAGQPVAQIIKIKVADLHVYFPQCDLDCRISVNVEVDYEGPVEGSDQIAQEGSGSRGDRADRHKDRLSYKQGLYKVDLTQVTQPDAGGSSIPKKIHELEIELDANAVVDQGRRAMESRPHNYDFLVEGFVNNIRLLARKSREFSHAP